MSEIWQTATGRIKISLFNLTCASILGCIMRLAFVTELTSINYKYILHAHSHIAMLGWVYLALFTLLIAVFLDKKANTNPLYGRLFWLTQVSVLGMLIAFPLQGYATWSIFFSALHVCLSYIFAFRFLKDLRSQGPASPASRLARWSIIWMLVSTLGLWALGPIKALGLGTTIWYHLAIQFFLHFQFNGWFVFALLALLFKSREDKSEMVDPQKFKRFFTLLLISCPLTFALAVAWSTPKLSIFLVNSLAVILQLASVFFLLLTLGSSSWWHFFRQKLTLIELALAMFVLKCVIQAVVVIPSIAEVAYTIRNFVLGFLHLLLLGSISLGLLALANNRGVIDLFRSSTRIALVLFIAGFAITEILLFVQGAMFWGSLGLIPYYYEILFISSLLLPIGAGGLFLSTRKRS